MPHVVQEMDLEYFLVAVEAGRRDDLERYQLAAYPVFLMHGKKGQSWSAFLRELGLSDRQKTKGGKNGRKLSRSELDELYAKADRIKKSHLGIGSSENV